MLKIVLNKSKISLVPYSGSETARADRADSELFQIL